ncbi:GRB2-associated-binding protein 2 [Cricetulus griseus]|uniref:GRB2-associated-binding protein 2 n=1 Tax=Cricetulus griseus TaxID=10029 RepID=G3GSH1_CRIGR|nr:GRB2-associated-binding protein 2 [Cricetulus griseus]
MSGDPDVLEYYKNEHSKKPLQIINLNFCKQLDVCLTFNKKELQKSFVFDIKTNELTFYLVAETEADMNRNFNVLNNSALSQFYLNNWSEPYGNVTKDVNVTKNVRKSKWAESGYWLVLVGTGT